MLKQIEVYRNGVLFANVPTQYFKSLLPIAQLPYNVRNMIADYVNGQGRETRSGGWSWNWKATSE